MEGSCALQQPLQQDHHDQHRQHELEVGLEPAGQAGAAAGIGLGQVFVKAPAPAAHAEQQVDQAADGQQQVADQEVLAVQHGGTGAQRLEAGPDVVAQHAGQAGRQQEHPADQHGLAAAQAELLHQAGDDVFKHRNDGGEAGEGHEQEEQRPPQPAAGQPGKDVGQGNEDQLGAAVRADAEGEAGREDDETRADGHEGVQHADAGRLAGQGVLALHIAAEDLHGADAETQRKEGLVHRVHDDGAQPDLGRPLHAGQQVEGQALAGAGQRQAVDHQHQDQQDQGAHHPFAHPFQAVVQPEAGHHQPQHHGQHGPEAHLPGVGQHLVKGIAGGLGGGARKGADDVLEAVVHHPAVDGGVIHHQQAAPGQAGPAVPVPLAALGFQRPVGGAGAAAARTPHGQLHRQHRDPHAEQEQQIEQHKHTAAALAGQGGEPPDIADADGAARADQDEAQPRSERCTFFQENSSFFPGRPARRHAGGPVP